MKIFSSIQYLAPQGLALRGHVEEQGNLLQLLQLRSQDVSILSGWLNKTTNFLSPDCQNEILSIFCHSIQKEISRNVNSESKQFGIIVDGTQDCAGLEQEAICIRYVYAQLQVREIFVGLYTPPDTKGKTLATVIQDVLLRLELPIANLRAQFYDGAANMSGEVNGCQAIIIRECPLVLFFSLLCSLHKSCIRSHCSIKSAYQRFYAACE